MGKATKSLAIGAAFVAAASIALFGGRAGLAAYGRLGGAEAQFADASAEAAARAACGSAAPFVVLDTFTFLKPANIDDDLPAPDGEAPGPISHGDVVAAIVAASHSDPVAYQIDPVFNVRTLGRDFARLARDIENGRIAKPAAVVSSIVLPVSLDDINARIPLERGFSPGDVNPRRRELLEVVTGGRNPANPYTEIDRQLGRLRALGVPVFVAAGNTAPDSLLNVLALSDGVYAVGSLDQYGRRAGYTSMPEMVSVWASGYVVLTQAPDGLSVSAGRSVELKGAALPEQQAVLRTYAGKRAKDVARDLPEEVSYLPASVPTYMRMSYLGAGLQPGIYRTADLMAAYGYAKDSGSFARAVAEGPYMHFPTDTIFTADADGVLRFDPMGDDTPGQLKTEDATSFAAPNLCATDPSPFGGQRMAASRG
ncbi:hypothetical protein [Hansschlegelia plantiphila]|uniref:Uncharacterized protein n=1 Tax=Hansschlegelia plantiphila TaxID=374655 RepID=A0A9W6J3Z0_9HYPH|nr:hypothetical protein [Hansschlegelia plantiphila]GLK69351.1 hypothetical protein GCM10008179_29890 [Hansschlegelia plantiphila]